MRKVEKGNIILILLILELLLNIPVNFLDVSAQQFQLVDTCWGSMDKPKNVYPGSRNVALIVLVVNNYKDLVSITGNLMLPEGFTDIYGSNIAKATGFVREDGGVRQHVYMGEVFELNFYLNINSSLKPGTYYAPRLKFSYKYLETNTLKNGSFIIKNIPIKVSKFPKVSFTIDNIHWSATDGSYINATPGGKNLVLNLDLKNVGEANLSSVDVYLYLPDGFKPDQLTYPVGAIRRGSVAALTFPGIYIDYRLEPGTYYGGIIIESMFRGYGGASKTYHTYIQVPIKIYEPSSLSISIISVGWSGLDTLYTGSREVNLEVKIQNIGFYRTGSLNIYLYMPRGFESASGLNRLNETYEGVLDYGDIGTLSLGPIYVRNVPPGLYSFTLFIDGFAHIGETVLRAYYNSTIHLRLTKYNSSLVVTSIEYNYKDQPGPLIPGAKNIQVIIKIANWGVRDISAVDAELLAPDGFKIYRVDAPSGDIPAATVFSIRFFMNISKWVKPGSYPVNLTISYIVDPNSANIKDKYITEVDIIVSDPDEFRSNIHILDAYWGVERPIEVYPGAKMVPLSILGLNSGPYDVRSLRIYLEVPRGMEVIYTSSSTSDIIPSLDIFSLTCYVNVSGEVRPGNHRINVTFSYILSIYGSDIEKRGFSNIYLYVYPPPAGLPYIKIVDYGWKNGYRAYPKTDNADLYIILADESPYPMSGINASLILPEGFSKDGAGSVSAYEPGPVNPWQTLTMMFEIDIGDVKPGIYKCNLIIRYILQSGGAGYPVTEYHKLSIRVDGVSGIEFATSYWLSGSAGPGAAGVHLLAVLRNVGFDRMYGIIAKVTLPHDVVSTVTGSETFNITPYIVSSATELAQLASFLQAGLLPTQAALVEAGKGDFIAIPMTINFGLDVEPGEYEYTITLFFLDEWDCNRAVNVNASMWVLGRTGNIVVLENKSAVFIGARKSQIVIFLMNNGSGPMYDVYISILSMSPAISFSSSVKYVPIIWPKQTIRLSWYASSTGGSYIGSIPALITTIYVDPSGNRITLNQTIILYVEGIAELKLIDVDVEPSPPYPYTEIMISGTIINIGTDTARSTEIFLRPNKYLRLSRMSYLFIGDIDPGTQIPFTLYVYVENYTGTLNITISLRYMNVFYETVKVTFPITVEVYPKPAKETPEGLFNFLMSEHAGRAILIGGVIGIIAVFAGLSLYFIHKFIGSGGEASKG